jgi:cobalt-precorrin-5B (C1)-methyltransferase
MAMHDDSKGSDVLMKKETKSLRRGYTTGACASAAAKAATEALKTGKAPKQIRITLPIRKTVGFQIETACQEGKAWTCAVRKDAGDDPDCTHGALIAARVLPREREGLRLFGGEGVGTVTKPGLGLEVGGPAINPVPRKMILQSVSEIEHGFPGLDIEISIPGGEELAKKTLNARLGILGGLSILGTTGIVKPFSTAAYRASIVQAIRVAASQRREHLVLTTGGRSENYARKIYPRLPEDAFIQYGDFIGAALQAALANGIPRLTICGMVGKISKIADRKKMTHASGSRVNMKLLASFAKECGADDSLLKEIENANTARHVGEIVAAENIEGFYDKMAGAACDFLFADLAKRKINIEVIITTLEEGLVLARRRRRP